MSVLPIRVSPERNDAAVGARRRALAVVGTCLLILLAFSTATVFVESAWPVGCFEIGIFTLCAACLLPGIYNGDEFLTHGAAQWFVYLIPGWGVFQILAHTTVSTAETREAVLRWGALSGVFLLTRVAASARANARKLVQAFLIFAIAVALLCLTQLFTSNGLILWRIPSGYPVVFATFQNRNNYAQFVELALPIAVWRAMCGGKFSWLYALFGAILYASVIAAAARTATILCTMEIMVILARSLALQRNPRTRVPERQTIGMVVLICTLATAFTLAVGWREIWERFQDKGDLFATRSAYLEAAGKMVKQRPLTGFGLDTFTEVYQQFAKDEFPFYANHVHNDWAEFAAGGGIPFLLIVFIPFGLAVPTAIRHPWGLGLIAVMIHACVDYPFPRPAVSGWLFLMLGILLREKDWDRGEVRYITPGARRPTTAA